MAVTTVAAPPRASFSVTTASVAVGVLLFAVLVIKGAALLNDPDTYSHLALGRWIIAHGWVPYVDPFSATMAGQPWVAFEWLSEVAYTIADMLDGWNGMVILAAAAIAAAFAMLAGFLLRRLALVPALTLVCAAYVLTAPHMLARPHVLPFPVMIVWAIALLRASEERRAPSFALLPLMTLWVNLHGSFLIGLGLVAGLGFEAVWLAAPAERRSLARGWLVFAALAVLAALINPYGPGIFSVIVETANLGAALRVIIEWQPQDFGHIGPFEVVLIGGVGYALITGMRLGWTRVLMLLGLLHLALAQTRQADVLALIAPLLLATPLAAHLGASAGDRLAAGTRRAALPVTAVAGLLLVAAVSFLALRPLQPPARITPAAAVAAADLAHVGPILNGYDFGGYLDYVGIRPFIDGRTELYGAAFTLRFTTGLSLQDLPGFLALLDKYGIQATLLPAGTPAIALLDRLPDWQRVYADDVAVVHVRRPAPTAAQ